MVGVHLKQTELPSCEMRFTWYAGPGYEMKFAFIFHSTFPLIYISAKLLMIPNFLAYI